MAVRDTLTGHGALATIDIVGAVGTIESTSLFIRVMSFDGDSAASSMRQVHHAPGVICRGTLPASNANVAAGGLHYGQSDPCECIGRFPHHSLSGALQRGVAIGCLEPEVT